MIVPADIVKAVENAALQTWPFIHLRLSSIFKQEDYQDILRLLPSSNDYTELRHKDAILPDNTSSRLEFLLTSDRLKRLDSERYEFWNNLIRAFHHPGVACAFSARFSELGCNVPLKTRGALRLSLVRDYPGYFIRPHQDIPYKLMTTQIYLPDSDRHSDLGTKLYTGGGGQYTEIQDRCCYTLYSKYRVLFAGYKKQLARSRCHPRRNSGAQLTDDGLVC